MPTMIRVFPASRSKVTMNANGKLTTQVLEVSDTPVDFTIDQAKSFSIRELGADEELPKKTLTETMDEAVAKSIAPAEHD